MTRSKIYRHGKSIGKTYLRMAGQGFETGFIFDSKTIFVGNFIHALEATLWFTLMNRELRQFARKYAVAEQYPTAWFAHFVRNHLYRTYYAFLNRTFARYNRDFGKALQKDVRKYQRMRRDWRHEELSPFLKVA